MSDAVISRSAKAERSASFDKLRARGIELIQQLSGSTWTDHNLHDPGITILEQLCYALTDLVYRSEFGVADHLTDANGCIDYPRLGLPAPQDVFPCRATSAADYRRVLLDQVPALADARLIVPRDTLPGLYRLQLRAAAIDADLQAAARAAYYRQRNLCEDLEPEPILVRDERCELHADIEIGGPRDAVDVLAEVYDRCALSIAADAVFLSLDERLKQGLALDRIFSGPATEHGFIAEDDEADETDTEPSEAEAGARLFVGNLTRLVNAIDGVKEVRRLALQREGEAPTLGSLPWRGDGWALRLHVPITNGEALHVHLTRRGRQLVLGPEDLRSKYEDLMAANRARRQASQDAEASCPMPAGTHRSLNSYYSLQNHFPAIYGLGLRGLPGSARPIERGRVHQLQAYLVMLEQVIAHACAQLQHLRELFSIDGQPARSYWWQMIDDEVVPQISDLYRQAAERIQAEVYLPFDDVPARKSRLLDHLLALHGETYSQHSMRQFWSYLGAAELEAALLRNKAEYAAHIVALSRGRGAGFDPGEPTWDAPLNSAGLQQRVSLLLGFQRGGTHSLTRALRQQHRELGDDVDDAHAGPLERWRDDGHPGEPMPLAEVPQPTADEMRHDMSAMPLLHGPRWNEHWFRVGLQAGCYAGIAAREGPGCRLLLGPDEQGRWWHLGDAENVAAAARAAASLRRFLLRLNHESEGLHLVEHLLLRPRARPDAHAALGLPTDFFAMRFSVVLPGWSARCRRGNFRAFTRETVAMNTPAHLVADCLWLGFDAMQRFEVDLEAWLAALGAWTKAPEDAAALDAAAAKIIGHLQRHGGARALDASADGGAHA